ncbi:prolyl oligopeptidase family serine peptidase [Pontibacillus litoralis]|uniref:Esterase n=1 Tax=Pontibacillus litoralis JSM 072002 TaxID=1385512 RepID=A0A0A5G6S0_9BACI|nr:prolyl oligopeptidase family serine peptidase [Pontibacillus litoralis]KGX87744.1 esterase [Pontibacillus litoralis JSM 072002]
MIGVYREKIEDIPVLIVVDATKENEPLPVVTYIHGITSVKEQNLPIAYALATKGYRVVLPDCYLHGERRTQLNNEQLMYRLWDVVAHNLKEIPVIYENMKKRHLLDGNRFGLAGTSMGGITTSAALTQFDWIKVAAVLMGTPQPVRFAKEQVAYVKETGLDVPFTEEEQQQFIQKLAPIDLSLQIDRLQGRPLFFWHGEKDNVVPFDHAYSFYTDAIPHYKNPENIRFLRELDRDHKVSTYAIEETANWFDLHL